jgi:hypothetical protein
MPDCVDGERRVRLDAERRYSDILRKRAYTGQFIDGKISVKKVDGVVKKGSNPESSHVYLTIPAIIDAQTDDLRTFRQPLEKFVKRVTIYSGKKCERNSE